jgi:transcriptional regulator with XRE-family HTH domain
MDAGRMMRAARRSRRLSQRELADLAGLPSSTVARIEASSTEPKVATFAQLMSSVGYELVLADRWCRLLTVDDDRDRLIDRAARRFPAHLSSGRTPHIADLGRTWWGWHHIAWWPTDKVVPGHTYWRRYEPPQIGEGWAQEVWDDAT